MDSHNDEGGLGQGGAAWDAVLGNGLVRSDGRAEKEAAGLYLSTIVFIDHDRPILMAVVEPDG